MRVVLIVSLVCSALSALAGLEDFANFPETSSTYADGTFTGQDGSTWTYVDCRGDKPIDAPSPTLRKGSTPASSVTSGLIPDGCGTLTFDWMQVFTTEVNLDVLVNGLVVANVTGGPQNITNSSGPLTIEQAGNFTLAFVQNNTGAGQVTIDNISWTTFAGGGSNGTAPQLVFSPSSTNIAVDYTTVLSIDITATEPDADTVSLWAVSVPTGAVFSATNGASPLASTFDWTPSLAETGLYTITFFAGDKDGTNQQDLVIQVHGDRDYYADAEGLTGEPLKQALHDIITSNSYQLTDLQEDAAMKKLHEDPGNSNNVILLYSRLSVAKSLYNAGGGWNKEHSWPTSRGLGNDGPDENDIHNLFAADSLLNANRGNLYFDESNAGDPGYTNPAATNAPDASYDSDSWEPPPEVKGDLARALFYMAVRYDGTQANTLDIWLTDEQLPTSSNAMGVLSTVLAWHDADPPDAWESNRNDIIYLEYQTNRNPFIDHPEWVHEIWATNNTPPVLTPIGTQYGTMGTPMNIPVQALPTEADPVTLSISNAPAGMLLFSTNENGVLSWTPGSQGSFTVDVYASDDDGADFEQVSLEISGGTQEMLLAEYSFGATGAFTNTPSFTDSAIEADDMTTHDGTYSVFAGSEGEAIADTGWDVTDYSAYFTFSITWTGLEDLVITEVKFDDRASSSGAQNWHLRSSADSFSADLAQGSTHTSFATNSAVLTNLSVSGGSWTLRIHGQDASSSAGTWRIDTVRVYGYLQGGAPDPDSDADGLPDDWELLYFTNLSATPLADDDSDTFDNWSEYIAGSHPTNGQSYLAGMLSRSGSTIRLHSDSVSTGRIYTLETGLSHVTNTDWTVVSETNQLEGGVLTLPLPGLNPSGSYRIKARLDL